MTDANSDSLDITIRHNTQPAPTWSRPIEFNLGMSEDRQELEHLFATGNITSVRDEIEQIANDLYEVEHSDKKDDSERRNTYVAGIADQGSRFGRWFLFSWSKQLVRYPEKAEHRAIRTSRHRDLTSGAQQDELFEKTVVDFGLSVGSAVVEQLVMGGVGGTLVFGDPDIIAPSNLNRIRGSMRDVGVAKIDHAAMNISQIDPYIKQIHFRKGATNETLRRLADLRPDLFFDEVDKLPAKAMMRQTAQRLGAPLVMATDLGDRSIFDVERYDTEPDTQPFGGRISKQEIENLLNGDVSKQEIGGMTIRICGVENISAELMASYQKVLSGTLPGIPQLGSTVAVNGGYAARVAREILLGHNLPSGRYIPDPHFV